MALKDVQVLGEQSANLRWIVLEAMFSFCHTER